MASHRFMKETGPEAVVPLATASAPCGLRVEKSTPIPPPCCIVIAASESCPKIPSSESSMYPITKQLKSVVRWSVPAPARIRPAGRNRRPWSDSWKVRSQPEASSRSLPAAALATRRHVSAIEASGDSFSVPR